jgi:hypothetical protein
MKFDSVTSQHFSVTRPQALIEPGNCKFPVNTTVSRRFEFQKRGQFFIRTHNEALTVAMGVNNPDRSRLGIEWLRHSPSPSGFLEVRQRDMPSR